MNRESWNTFNKVTPVDLRLLLYGAVCGVVMGSLSLIFGYSLDEATARGLANLIHTTVGIWLGVKLCSLEIHALAKWLDSLSERLTVLRARLGLSDDARPTSQTQAPVQSSWLTIVRYCIYMTPVGAVLLVSSSIAVAIDFSVDVYTSESLVSFLILAALVFSLCISVQCINLWRMSRKLSRLERRLESINSIDRFALNTQEFGQAFSNTDTFVYKVTGQRLAA